MNKDAIIKYLFFGCTLTLAACRYIVKPGLDDQPGYFITNMKLDGLIPYRDSYNHVLNCLGRPDSITAIYTDKTDTTKNTRMVYFKNSCFFKYGDSVKLEAVVITGLASSFVSCGKLKLNSESTIDSVKSLQAHDMDGELDDDVKIQYKLWGIADNVKPGYNYWMLYFDRKTNKLLEMKHVMYD
ncbi:MAG: hypothetical protein V4592_03795 [Bacteroidota bacterium]